MPDTPSMIERVARALCEDDWSEDGMFDEQWEEFADDYRKNARAVLAAMRESSTNMSFAGAMAAVPHGLNLGNGQAQDVWRAMIDAALSEGDA